MPANFGAFPVGDFPSISETEVVSSGDNLPPPSRASQVQFVAQGNSHIFGVLDLHVEPESFAVHKQWVPYPR